MKKNLYYRTVFRRKNLIKEAALSFFLAFCSWPRLLLEVFVRRNFGERYFSFMTAIFVASGLAVLPILYFFKVNQHELSLKFFLLHWLSWYLYLASFIITCVIRRKELERLPSVFDFKRFSLSTGLIHPFFTNYKIAGKLVDVRTIETKLEPGLFFLSGLALWLFGQFLGNLLIVSSLFYAMSYRAQYHLGDHFVMDKIDELIANEEVARSFIDGVLPKDTRGFNFYGRRPADPDMRRKLVESFFEEEEIAVAM